MCLPPIVIGTSCDAVCFMCGRGFSSFWFRLYRTGYKDVFNTLVTGRRCIGQCLFTGYFKQCIWVFLSKLQKSHTTSVGLLFHTFGGQYCIDHSVRIYANPLSPFAEPVAVPFQIFLVVLRHMFRDRAVLPMASFQATMGSDAVMVVENFNGGICYLYINFLFDVFIWNWV